MKIHRITEPVIHSYIIYIPHAVRLYTKLKPHHFHRLWELIDIVSECIMNIPFFK
jgi:hypothetical protein